MQRGETRNPLMELMFVMLSCGLYYLYYDYRACHEINRGLGREEFDPVIEVALTAVTCGLWRIFFAWRASQAIVELQRSWGVRPEMDAVGLFILNLLPAGVFFMQRSFNNAWDHGTPGGPGEYGYV